MLKSYVIAADRKNEQLKETRIVIAKWHRLVKVFLDVSPTFFFLK